MTIELQLIKIIIQDDLQENYTGMLPVPHPYFIAQKFQKRRMPKKRKTVAHLIDALINDIDRME